LRIISGKLKGKLIKAPEHLPVRPTTDFAKTGLFNLLENRVSFDELTALDLFSGIGSISFEMISRGCSLVHSVENNKACADFQIKLAELWKTKELKVHKDDAFSFLKRNASLSFDLIFSDPPYSLKETFNIPGMVFDNAWLNPDGWLVIEHEGNHDWRNHHAYQFTRNYGRVHFSFFHNNP
jgi:16S rRNA (guanine(966)-N(2))-methyltransferase RsmD